VVFLILYMRNFRNLLSVFRYHFAVALEPAGFFVVFDGINAGMLGKPAYHSFDSIDNRVHPGGGQMFHFGHVYV